MKNVENIPFLLQQIEGKLNSLSIEQDKLDNPLFDIEVTKNEILRIESEIDPIKKELISYTDIQRQKELMRIRLTEYMDVQWMYSAKITISLFQKVRGVLEN